MIYGRYNCDKSFNDWRNRLDPNFKNYERLFYENQILEKQLKQLESFVIEAREKNLALIEENIRLQSIGKIKFTLLFYKLIKKSIKVLKNEIRK
jgi:hypothetical protein